MIYLLKYSEKFDKPCICFDEELNVFNLSLDELLREDLCCKVNKDNNIIILFVRPEWLLVDTIEDAKSFNDIWRAKMMKLAIAGQGYDDLLMKFCDYDTIRYYYKGCPSYSLYLSALSINTETLKVSTKFGDISSHIDGKLTLNMVDYVIGRNNVIYKVGNFSYFTDEFYYNESKPAYGITFRDGKWCLGEFLKSEMVYIALSDILVRWR